MASNTAPEASPETSQDAAWASFPTGLDVSTLTEFCRDIERLFRINPFIEFKQWQQTGDNRYRFAGKNSSQKTAFDFDVELSVETTADTIVVKYLNGLKNSTTFHIEPVNNSSKLTITEDYSESSEEERTKRAHEVDKSLVTWANDLQQFLVTWKKWCWLAPWRWYMRYTWQPLKPSGRRIVYMLLWISLVEVALIALGAGIYWSEYGSKQ